jgi:diaminohydroxyphosphoribosylaminopyrimidine deaminase/5-amino-6-(5-phosphoribosylamino)uracil reductase
VETACAKQGARAQRRFPLAAHAQTTFVRCKIAASLDGATAMANGENRWITSEAARNDVQRLRARSSAIVTGIGTALHDDPQLTVRLRSGAWVPAPRRARW